MVERRFEEPSRGGSSPSLPAMRPLLLILLAAVLLTCTDNVSEPVGQSLRNIPADTIPLDSLRIWNWPRELSPPWEAVAVSPLTTKDVPGSRYTGFVSIQPGPLEAQYVHWYDWRYGDTLRLDFQVRVRCRRTTIATFEEIRVLLPMTPQLQTPLDVTVTVPGATQHYLMARGYVAEIRDPEAVNPEWGRLLDIEYGRWVPLDALTQCGDDSVYVRLEIANLLNEGYAPPRPLWIWVELRNQQAMQTVIGKIAVGLSIRENDE